LVLPRRHGKPRSETQQPATTQQASALPTHPDGVWRWTTFKQAGRARLHEPRRNKAEKPSKFAKQRHLPRCHEARANSRNDALTMGRCDAPGRNQTRITHQIRHHARRVSEPHPPKLRAAPGIQMPRSETCPDAKTHWRSGAAQPDAGFRASPDVRPPLRTSHGTTRQVASVRNSHAITG